MAFKTHFTKHCEKYASMQPQDAVKLCYQAAFGAEHLLSDLDGARDYLEKEYSETVAEKGVLYEPISDLVCRIQLSAWKEKKLPTEWLFRIFAASCTISQNAQEQFWEYVKTATQLLPSLTVGFTLEAWQSYLLDYKKSGMPPVRHSNEYRKDHHPAYRIADSRFCRILPILEKANLHPTEDRPCIIAIDGRAASGKTTLAALLQTVLDADVIHMDDFFLPPPLRTKERFEKPGENIHHERFFEEVLPHLPKKEAFSYRIFDCSRMDYNQNREIGTKPFRIVEGSYSCHPLFSSYADITVFAGVPKDEQTARIRTRNGEEMLQSFLTRWIPLEEEYFSHFAIEKHAHLIV